MSLFLTLLAGHFLADYPLQGDFLGRGKNRHVNLSSAPMGGVYWWHCMTAHAAIHAGTVALITGSWWLGSAEFVVHWVIDYMKCEGWTEINGDQALHICCKIAYALLVAGT